MDSINEVVNPFDDPKGLFSVLVNEANQHSLWPDGTPVPDGWEIVLDATNRSACLDYVSTHWTDMRPWVAP